MTQMLLSLLLCLSLAACAQKPAPLVPAKSKLFISPLGSDLHTFLAAEIANKRLPFIIVTNDQDAEYILAGPSKYGGKDSNRIYLVSMDEKVKIRGFVWKSGVVRRSLLEGGWERGEQSMVADRIISNMKDDLFGK